MEYTTIGTDVKVLLDFKVESTQLSMADYDFTARFFTYADRFVDIPKEDMLEYNGCYIAVVPTTGLSDGELRVEVQAYIPDTSTTSGVRIERTVTTTGIYLKRSIYDVPAV